MNTSHGKYGSRTYFSWVGAKSRCGNKNNDNYPRYGGRGITVCDRWIKSFENFYADMCDRPEGKTLDRIDGSGNYSPENCKWSTPIEQTQNRKRCASGFIGVCVKNGRYRARITRGGLVQFLGSFKTIQQAIAARYVAEKRYDFQTGVSQ